MGELKDAQNDFFSCCPAMVFSAEPDTTLRVLSELLERLLGTDAHDGTRLSDYVHPHDRGAFDAGWERIDERAEPRAFEFRLREVAGGYVRFTCTARRSRVSGAVHGVLREATETSTISSPMSGLTREIEQKAAIIRLLAESLPIGLWLLDRDGIFVMHEGRALAQVGFRQGQCIGQDVRKIFAQHPMMPLLEQAYEGKTGHMLLDEVGFSWEAWYIPVHNATGEVTAVLGVSLNVSEAKREDREVIQQQDQIIRALSAPIIEVWDKVLTLPLLGMLDGPLMADLMTRLLAEISRTSARFAILDLTGIESMESAAAEHLIKLVQATRLLGAEGLVTGVQPGVARAMTALALNLGSVVVRSKLRDGLRYCIQRMRGET